MSHWPVVRSVKLVFMCAQSVEVDFAIGFILVYDSAGEPVRKSGHSLGESASGSEFEVGGATSGEDFPRRVSRKAPSAAVAES